VTECALCIVRGDFGCPMAWPRPPTARSQFADGPVPVPASGSPTGLTCAGVVTPASCFGYPLLHELVTRGLFQPTHPNLNSDEIRKRK